MNGEPAAHIQFPELPKELKDDVDDIELRLGLVRIETLPQANSHKPQARASTFLCILGPDSRESACRQC
jgi:hypothetical protein